MRECRIEKDSRRALSGTETRIDVVKDDPTDNRILECAVASGSDYLVSGDNHLLKVGKDSGVKILKAADFLDLQLEKGR